MKKLFKTYRIETDRLLIRCYRPADASLLKKSIDESLDHLQQWIPWAIHEPETLEDKVVRLRRFRGEFDLGINYTYGIFNKEETLLLGSTGFHPRVGDGASEIGYWLHKDHVSNGYASETVRALTKVAFEIEKLDRIEIRCDPINSKSLAIPLKLGFTHEATLRRRRSDGKGNLMDTMIWVLFKDEYLESDLRHTQIRAFDLNDRQIS